MNNEIYSMISPHPVKSMTYEDLYNGIQNEVLNGNVFSRKNGDLELYDYSPTCQFEKKWNKYNLVCRGLILDLKNKRVVNLPMPKFFNSSELPELPNMGFSVSEKLDGSCGIVWFYNNVWNCNTRGSFNSDQAIWATNWLRNNPNVTEKMNKDWTYIFEVIYASNTLVVRYPFEGLTLLNAYSMETGKDLNNNELMEEANRIGVRYPKFFHYSSVDEILKIAENLPGNEEGFVVRFDNGMRVKVKGKEYIRLHRIISGVTPIRIWEILLHNDNFENTRNSMPDEVINDFDILVNYFKNEAEKILRESKNLYERTKDMSDKECGFFLKNSDDPYKHFVFPWRKGLMDDFEVGNSKARKAVFNLTYPKGNVIKGFTFIPSRSMNRVNGAE